MTVIGIDPGASGGLAALSPVHRPRLFTMPRDVGKLTELIRSLIRDETYVFIEQVPKFTGFQSTGAKNIPGSAIAVMYGNFQLVVGICYGLGNPPVLLPPLKWQNLVECRNRDHLEKGAWKNKLKFHAKGMFPGTDVTLATADALLIAKAGQLLLRK